MLHKALEDGSIRNLFHLRCCPLVTHLLYANDVLVFTNGERQTLRKLLTTIKSFGRWVWSSYQEGEVCSLFLQLNQPVEKDGSPLVDSFLKRTFPLHVFWFSNHPGMHMLEPLVEKIHNKVAS